MPTATVASDNFPTKLEKQKLIARLARVEGQLRGVQRMIDGEEECERIAQQLAAARGALNKAFFELLACAFETKLATDDDPSHQKKVHELAHLLSKYA